MTQLGHRIDKLARSWVEYNQRFLMKNVFETEQQISYAIDIGCSHGNYSSFLLERLPVCKILVGIDVSKDRIRHAVHISMDSRVTYIVAEAHTLPFRKSTFHLAFSKDLLHHMKNPVEGLREMNRVSGGTTIIIEANRSNPIMLLWTKYFNHQHFTLEQLEHIVNKAKLRFEKSKHLYAYPFDLLLLPLKNPIMLVWDLAILILLFMCRIVPALPRKILRLLLALEYPFNIIYISDVSVRKT